MVVLIVMGDALFTSNAQKTTNQKLSLNLFLEAVDSFGLPSRIRFDFETENVEIAEYMLNHPAQGPNRGSKLTG